MKINLKKQVFFNNISFQQTLMFNFHTEIILFSNFISLFKIYDPFEFYLNS